MVRVGAGVRGSRTRPWPRVTSKPGFQAQRPPMPVSSRGGTGPYCVEPLQRMPRGRGACHGMRVLQAGVVGLPGAGIMVVLGWALAVIDLLRTASWLGVTGWASALAGLVILWAGR